MRAVSQVRSFCVSACVRPSCAVNVTSNKFLVLSESSAREGCSDSRAQGVKALSPGGLPFILPSRETFALAVHVDRNDVSSSSGKLTTRLRVSVVELGVSCSLLWTTAMAMNVRCVG